jgi:hypothetical protein
MENAKVYIVEQHYLVQIDDAQSRTWFWDVYIASKGEDYFGMAEAKDKIAIIPWVELKEMNPLDEMVKIIQTRINEF